MKLLSGAGRVNLAGWNAPRVLREYRTNQFFA